MVSSDYLSPFSSVRGPRNAKVLACGEAWGREEDLIGVPFIGQAGQELGRMMDEVEFPRNEVLYTNLLNLRPQNNKFESLLVPKAQVGKDYKLPPVAGKYLPWDLLPHLGRLWKEILTTKPNLVIAFGGKACWALCGTDKIRTNRGAINLIQAIPQHLDLGIGAEPFTFKVLPTYHPAAVLRNWSLRVIVKADLMKAKREMAFPEFRRVNRRLLVNPTILEIRDWVQETLAAPPPCLGGDIETKLRQIEMFGISRSRSEQATRATRPQWQSEALIVPFHGPHQGSFWPTHNEEVQARQELKPLLDSDIPWVGQNFLYDIQYLWREGLRPRVVQDDTMLLHHSLYPEMEKGLGFLGSIYSNEPAWKLMRTADSQKRDE